METYLKTILDGDTDNIVLMNMDYKVIYFNETTYKTLLDLQDKHLKEGDDYRNYVIGSEMDLFLESFAKALGGESTVKELKIKSIWYRYEFSPLYDAKGGLLGILLKIRNIDKQKLTEIALTQSKEIKNGIIRRNLELEQFVYIVSHNIRAPIATMLGLSGILEGSLDGKDRAFALSGLRKSIENLDNVFKDLNEVLLVRRDSSENKSIIKFKEVLQTVEESLKGMIEKNTAKISSDFGKADSIMSNRSFIYNIFFNLVSNGIKYRREDVSPEIDIWTEKANDKIILYIRDNGKGIDMEKYGKQIFGLYKKFDLDVEGKGLGLFLVKTQVETMDGTISVESEIGKGTKFKIVLPDIR